MSNDSAQSVLTRMTRKAKPAASDVPLTVSRAVRLSATRAAESSIGLVMSVLGVGEEVLELDDLLAQLTAEMLILALDAGQVSRGIIACDSSFCAAALEVQTLGQLSARAPVARPITTADTTMVVPFFAAVLAELGITTPGTALEGWADDMAVGMRFAGPRGVGFALPDGSYRLIRMTLDLGVADRGAELLIALPVQHNVVAALTTPKPKLSWRDSFQAAVRQAPATLDAVLHRFELPLSVATTLDIGQVIPLHGCTVGSVRLTDPDGRCVARGRLGQIAGKIAVRIEPDQGPELIELPATGHDNAASGFAVEEHGSFSFDDDAPAPMSFGEDDDAPAPMSFGDDDDAPAPMSFGDDDDAPVPMSFGDDDDDAPVPMSFGDDDDAPVPMSFGDDDDAPVPMSFGNDDDDAAVPLSFNTASD